MSELQFPEVVDKHPRETHGLSRTREYFIWNNMVQRCTNPKHRNFKRYGGLLCDRWLSFENFFEDMGLSNGLTLERRKNEEGYCKSNCVWANRVEQARNTRRNRIVEFNGVAAPLVVHCGGYGNHYKKVWRRIFDLGWTVERALGDE